MGTPQKHSQDSKIMVTTRKEGVAKMMGSFDKDIFRPQHLTDEECWSLLRLISHSGRSEEECGTFEDVGKKIAIKCRGLPLAAKVLGSLLQRKRSLKEWENVLESEIWRLEKAELELFPHLLLSYNELSPSLKRCFSYCSVYPKDYKINAESLMEEWMALGYLGPVAGEVGVEVQGRDNFDNLAMCSLFQDFEQSDEWSEEIEWCKMHDIVHDFAKFLRKNNDKVPKVPKTTKKFCKIHDPLLVSQVQEYRSLFWDKATPNICDCVTSVRVLRFKAKLNGPPKGIEKLIHLRWLELSGRELHEEDLQMILKTLLLESCSIKEIPEEIKNLVQLRHLHLSRNEELKELPDGMCSLVELQILNIQGCGCGKVSVLPEWMDKLKNLQHLFVEDSRCLPQVVGQLTGLRTLSCASDEGAYCNKLALLKNLKCLTGSLKLHMLIRSSSDLQKLAEDAREAELRNKAHIRSLELRFINESNGNGNEWSSSLWMDVMEALEPHHNLKKLHIQGYGGSTLPNWITLPVYSIKEIKLSDLSELLSLPPMGKLPFLERLYLKNLMKMKVLGRDFFGLDESSSSTNDGESRKGNSVVAFPRLEKLSFNHLPEWEEWEDITSEEEESIIDSIMPRLASLSTIFCDATTKLPHRFLRNRTSNMEILHIAGHDTGGSHWGYGHDTGGTTSLWGLLDPFQDDWHFHPA